MDTASSQLIYRGIDPLLRSSHSQRHNNLPLRRRRSNRISAVATDPKPAPVTTVNGSSSRSPPAKPVNGVSGRIGDVSKEIKRVRAQMEEDEQLASLMRGLRGQSLNDSLFAEDDVQLRLVEVDESSEFLPLVYDPASITAYWGKRPRSVATRIVQLLSVAGGFLSRVAWDVVNKKVKEKGTYSIEEKVIQLQSELVGNASKVTGIKRCFRLVEGNLCYEVDMSTNAVTLQPHLKAKLKKL